VFKPISQQCPVREAGEVVVERLMRELFNQPGPICDVAETPHPADDFGPYLLGPGTTLEDPPVLEFHRVKSLFRRFHIE